MKFTPWLSTVILAGAVVWTSSLSAVELEFQPGTKKDATRTELDPYFLMHAVHGGVFRTLNVGLNPEETVQALTFIAENVSFGSPSTIVVKKFRGGPDLRLGFALLNAGEMNLFLVVSNYDPKTNEVKEGPVNERFGRSFVIRNSRLVGEDENDVDGKKEIDYKAARNLLSLANLYLLDGKPEHEEQAMKLLLKIEKDMLATPLDKYFAFLTRGQAALIKKDFTTAASIAAEAPKRLSTLKAGPDRETGQEVLKLFLEEFTLTKMLSSKSRGPGAKGEQHH